jgi:sulfatase maturation enzyme AslB (radical SAM superfamily)
VPTKAELAKLERKARLQLQKKAETKIEHHQKKLAHFQKCLEEIKGSLDIVNTSDGKTEIKPASIEVPVPESEREKPSIVHDSKHHEHKEPEPIKNQTPAKKKRVSGFEEWADKTFSICTGCENDCIYCWAKEGAIRRKQVLPGKWKETTLRQHDVDRKHRAYGRC